jgi:hypothetical protein
MWEYERKIAAWFIVIPGVVLLLYNIFGRVDTPSKDPFEVISSYKGCDVVKYTDESQRWYYFLKCAPETYETHTETTKNI